MLSGWKRSSIMLVCTLVCGLSVDAQSDLDEKIDKNISDWVGTYKHLHENPELSTQEKETSALIAGQLKKLGYEVTDHFGKYANLPDSVSYGIVAVLKNGPDQLFMYALIWMRFLSPRIQVYLMPAKFA
jgi:hypothetical protein